MASAGVGETVLPIIGKMSPQMFDVKADPEAADEGAVAVDVRRSGRACHPAFNANISEVVPPEIADLDTVFYTTIGRSCDHRTHQFDALMVPDAAGKQVVDMLGHCRRQGIFLAGLTRKDAGSCGHIFGAELGFPVGSCMC